MDQNNQIEDLPSECASALQMALEGAGGTAAAHVQQCSRCQAVLATSAQFQSVLAPELSSRPEAAFTRNVMSRLLARAAATATGSATKGLLVIARPEPRRWAWGLAAAAAIVAITVGVGIAGGYFQKDSTPVASSSAPKIERGALADGQGKAVKRLDPGTRYTARERTVVAIRKDTLLRFEAGTAFEVGGEDQPGVKLAVGDMYASTPDSTTPLRVSLKNFDTDLHGGEYFVAQEESLGTQGVVIVFSGTAHVRVNRDLLLPLNAGQIYYNVEQDGTSSDDTLRADQIVAPKPGLPVESEMKKLYADRVKGFEAELDQIQKKLAGQDEGSMQRVELQERARRVEEYLQQHRERLQAMGGVDQRRSVPYEQIQRGLRGRTDPATWRM